MLLSCWHHQHIIENCLHKNHPAPPPAQPSSRLYSLASLDQPFGTVSAMSSPPAPAVLAESHCRGKRESSSCSGCMLTWLYTVRSHRKSACVCSGSSETNCRQFQSSSTCANQKQLISILDVDPICSIAHVTARFLRTLCMPKHTSKDVCRAWLALRRSLCTSNSSVSASKARML
jgi:hypothetical protein